MNSVLENIYTYSSREGIKLGVNFALTIFILQTDK